MEIGDNYVNFCVQYITLTHHSLNRPMNYELCRQKNALTLQGNTRYKITTLFK